MNVHIRWMIHRDMPQILAIESASHDRPWCEEEFLRILRQRNCIGMVAETCDPGSPIFGYMVYEPHRTFIEVLDFTVHPDHRRHGVGRRMIEKLVTKLSIARRSRLLFRVRETSLPAHLFLRACGLKAQSVAREYFGEEDGYVFVYRLMKELVEAS
jgi:ribosomal-protein-alanine N-acetyltransferase